jgi:predicted amidohydrolase
MRVACCQLAPAIGDQDGNAELAASAISGAVDAGADVIVLPELTTSGYVFRSRDEVEAVALGSDAALFGAWSREAARGDALVIAGFAERAASGTVHNSAVALDADGVLAVYRKIHLWDEERQWFAEGQDPAPVLDTRHGRIGLSICYDIEFPEVARGLALAGAELIASPTNWPREEAPPDGRPILHSLAVATAYLNKVFVAVCDRCGVERGLEFQGGSVIAGPDGALLAGPPAGRGAATLLADCDLDRARDKRCGKVNDAFADRRPDRYAVSAPSALVTSVTSGSVTG